MNQNILISVYTVVFLIGYYYFAKAQGQKESEYIDYFMNQAIGSLLSISGILLISVTLYLNNNV